MPGILPFTPGPPEGVQNVVNEAKISRTENSIEL